jgi:hypothetical protein
MYHVFLLVVLLAVEAVDYVSITDYGAVADGKTDCMSAISAAISAAKSKNIAKVYVPSAKLSYIHSGIIEVSGIMLYGDGYSSWLHGTVPTATPVKLINSNSGVSNLRLTSIAQDRQSVPWSVTVWCYEAKDFVIDRVWVEPLPGQGKVNGTLVHGVGGIFIYGCMNGVISNNNLNFTYADSIHQTATTMNTVVRGNRIENSGDDGVACVSYLPAAVNKNITVSNNTVRYNRWGRAITIIGGDSVVIEDNVIEYAQGASIWLASETSYNTSAPTNSIVRRNTALNSGYTDGACTKGNSLPAMGIDQGNPQYSKSYNIQFVDNVINTACNDLFRIDGKELTDVTVAGNHLINTDSFNVIIYAVDVNIYFSGNVLDTAKENSIVGVNTQNLLAIHNNILRNSLLDTTRVQVVEIASTNYIQFTRNEFTATTHTNAHILLEVDASRNVVDENNNSTLTDKLPPNTSTYPLPTAKDFSLKVSGTLVTIDAKEFISRSSGNNLEFIVAYAGQEGIVNTSIDRSTVTFRFTGKSTTGSFKYILKSSSGGIDSATCTLTL